MFDSADGLLSEGDFMGSGVVFLSSGGDVGMISRQNQPRALSL